MITLSTTVEVEAGEDDLEIDIEVVSEDSAIDAAAQLSGTIETVKRTFKDESDS